MRHPVGLSNVLICAVAARHWPRAIDDGVVVPAFVSPNRHGDAAPWATMVRIYETNSELAASGKSGLW